MTETTDGALDEPRQQPWWRRWWKHVTAAVLGAGALAGAVSSVLALLPDHPPPPPPPPAAASFVAAPDAIAPMPLSRYHEPALPGAAAASGTGSGAARRLAVALAVAAASTAGADSATESATQSASESATGTPADSVPGSPTDGSSDGDGGTTATTGTPEGTLSPSSTPGGTPTGTEPPSSSLGPSGAGQPCTAPPTDAPVAGLASSPCRVGPLVGDRSFLHEVTRRELARTDTTVVPLMKTLDEQLVLPKQTPPSFDHLVAVARDTKGEDGKPVSDRVAARRVVKLLRDTRAERVDGRRDPVGAQVEANITVTGLKGQLLSVTWSVYLEGTGKPLHRSWVREVIGAQFRPPGEDQSESVSMWVPLPRKKRDYVVVVRLYGPDGTRLAHGQTPAIR
jgi:hypothetical protein